MLKKAKNQGVRLFLSQPSSLRAQRSNLVLDFVFWSFGFVSDFVFRISSFSSPAAIKIKKKRENLLLCEVALPAFAAVVATAE